MEAMEKIQEQRHQENREILESIRNKQDEQGTRITRVEEQTKSLFKQVSRIIRDKTVYIQQGRYPDDAAHDPAGNTPLKMRRPDPESDNENSVTVSRLKFWGAIVAGTAVSMWYLVHWGILKP
jgi:hypothetical protein